MTAFLENRGRGILWMLATMLCFITLDAIIKAALAHYSLVEVTWGRFFFATLAAAIWCGKDLPRYAVSQVPKQQTVRSVFLMATTGLFNAGIMFVPLVTATTIMYLTPIVTTALSVLILRESVGIRRWIGVALGLVGALIIVQPWEAFTVGLDLAPLLVVAAAFTNASYQIATRSVRVDAPQTSLLFTAALGALMCSAVLPWFWQWPDAKGWAMLAGSGLVGALGHYCIIQAFRNAPASVVAPYSYSSLVWSTLFGYLIWSEVPASHVWLGAAFIIASGLYILWRERVRHIENPPEPTV